MNEPSIRDNYSNLNISPVRSENPKEREYFLLKMIGKPLEAVTFVMNYLQLQIRADPHFKLYTWPILYKNGDSATEKEPCYRDWICSFIGKPITYVDEHLDAGLVLEFEEGSIEVPLGGNVSYLPKVDNIIGFLMVTNW